MEGLAPFARRIPGESIPASVLSKEGGSMIQQRIAKFSIAATLVVMASVAQPPRREPTPNDTLKSPEILPDNRVTFRIYAPKASEVSVGGDWIAQGRGTGGKLEKDDKGVWSTTVGPLVPDFYSYSFTVDGVRTIDPKNAMLKQGVATLDHLCE